METQTQTQTLLPSPTSSSSSSNHHNHHNNGVLPPPPQPKQQSPLTRSESNPYPTTFVQADTSSFKQVVQMLTGSSDTPKSTSKSNNPIPPIKTPIAKSKLYERRSTTLKNLRLSSPSLSPRHPPNNNNAELLSPSLLDFPSLVLSPVTPLIHDPFVRSPISSNSSSSSPHPSLFLDKAAEDKAISEKSFLIHHPSPVSTPRDSEPRLLPLFPVSSPRVPGSNHSTS